MAVTWPLHGRYVAAGTYGCTVTNVTATLTLTNAQQRSRRPPRHTVAGLRLRARLEGMSRGVGRGARGDARR